MIFASIFDRFSFDLGGQLGAMLAPKTRPRRLQEASKTAPKTKCATVFYFDRILVDFGLIFARLLVDFWLILDRFLIDFPSIFGQVSGWCFARFLIKRSTIFYLLARFLVDCSSAVAGTQLCCALDPPRQAMCLRMAYRVPYPNLPSHLPFLLISFLTFLFLSIYQGYT